MSKLFAHSESGLPEGEWELLADHLADVAKLAANFCARFGAEEPDGVFDRCRCCKSHGWIPIGLSVPRGG